jgi:DNA-binding FadR family transcriptional regulator
MHAGKAIHTKIAGIAGNSWAGRLHEQVSNQLQRYRMYTNHAQQRREDALAEHRSIVEAVASGDPDEASRRAFAHVISARDEALRAISVAHVT